MTGIAKNTLVNYENDISAPQSNFLNKILELHPDINPTWLLTGEGSMRREATSGHIANGHNIIQGAHIDAEDVHLTVQQAGQASDPVEKYGINRDYSWFHDWIDDELKGKSISEVMSFAVKFKQLLDLDKER